VSKHTDKTSEMVADIKRRIDRCRNEYTIQFKTSKPQNETQNVLKDIKYRFECVRERANNYGIKTEFNILFIPDDKDQPGYNCCGCRKRKKGDYMWFGYDTKPIDPKDTYGGWFNRIGKVCSEECANLMTMRLM
jgi:hypothetical protein